MNVNGAQSAFCTNWAAIGCFSATSTLPTVTASASGMRTAAESISGRPYSGAFINSRAAGRPSRTVKPPTTEAPSTTRQAVHASNLRAASGRPEASSGGTCRMSARSSPMRAMPEPKVTQFIATKNSPAGAAPNR